MRKRYSTCIIPETSEELLFSIASDDFLYHVWKNDKKDTFVLIKASNNMSIVLPNQLMNFNEHELKRYLYAATNKLKDLDSFLFFNEKLWDKHLS